MDTFYDILRLVNAALASLVFCALIYRGRLYFPLYDRQQKLLYVSFTLYAGTAAYVSVEAFSFNLPPGYSVYPILAANAIALYAFLRYKESAFTPSSVA